MTDPQTNPDPDSPELELTFPCTWNYMVVVEHESHLRAALKVALADEEHRLEPSRKSKGGRYLSFHLAVEVESDERRLAIFRALHEHPAVKYVL